MSDNTYKALLLSTALENHGGKPVYAYCGYNYYRLIRVIDMGEYIILESPEEEGCWMPSDSIRESQKSKTEVKIITEDDNGPELA